jgi:hypothetical protein
MGKAHLSTRMRRDHTRQGTATHTDAAVPQTLGGAPGGYPCGPTKESHTVTTISGEHVATLISSTMVGSGEPGAMHPARRQRSAVPTGTRFVSLPRKQTVSRESETT